MSGDAPTCCLGARIVWQGQTGNSRTGLTDHYRCSGCDTVINVTR